VYAVKDARSITPPMFVLSRQSYLYRPLRSGVLTMEFMEEEGHVTFMRLREENGGAVYGVSVEGGDVVFVVFVEFIGVVGFVDPSVAVLEFDLLLC
jgi:hypothetical protein